MLAPTLFSIFLAAVISLAAVDQANGVGIIYRTDGELFNMRRLKAKTKVKATSIVDLQYYDDYAIAAHTEIDLQNTIDAFSESYKLLGLTVNVKKTKVIFQPAQQLTATAPNMTLKVLRWKTSTTLHSWVALEVGKHQRSTQDQMCVLFIRQAERTSLLRKRHQNSNQYTSLLLLLLLLSTFSHQGSPQRIFLLQLFLSTVSSSVASTSAMSSFTTSINLLFGLPRFLFPGNSILSILLPIYPSSFLRRCPYHLSLASRVFSPNFPPVLSL